jgi:tetratricopeptide (TPR) repeat protein
MPQKPDFIGDQNGNLRDVRGRTSTQTSPSSSQPPASQPSIPGKNRGTRSTQRTPGGIILIPIGLIIALIITVFRFLGGPAQKNSYPESDVNTLNSGLYSYDQGDYEKALMYFNMVIMSRPSMGEAYNDRGLVYYTMGETDNAMQDFNKAIELLPDPAIAYSNRGGLYLFQGNHAQALADLDKAIELSPRLAKAYHNRGLTYLDLGSYDQAIADFDQAIELTPEFIFSVQATEPSREPSGVSLLGSGLDTGLINQQTYADLPKAYASRAIAYFHMGDYAKAAADITKASELGLDMDFAQQVEAQLLVSTSSPQAEQTSPISISSPRSGHWEGSSNLLGVQGAISFDVWVDGQIYDFILALKFASGSSCELTSYEVFVQPDGTFSFTINIPGIENGMLTQGQFESSTVVNGSFSGYIQCITSTGELINGGQLMGDPWSAQRIYGP